MTYKQIIKKYSSYLKTITHIPQKEIEIIILYLIQKNTIWLHLNYNKECFCEEELKKLVNKRATNYPLEYIIQKVSFYGEIFSINQGVLIPRPETELLVEKAEKILHKIDNPKVIEIGTGSGIISIMLAILIEDIKIIAVDINDKAIELAKLNAKKHNVEDKITFLKSDLFSNITNDLKFNMCISNPPYISNSYKLPSNVKYEPSNALFGGNIGDELLKNIIFQVDDRGIKYLLCEMGYDQKKSISNYLKSFYTKNIEFYKDFDKFDRGFYIEF
jgi:release factor glutamine methyltransferase